MASTNKTTNLLLSQFVSSDKPAWLTDYNADMVKIDNAVKENEDDIDSLETSLSSLSSDVASNTSAITSLNASVSQHGTDITDLKAQDIIIKNDITNLQNKDADYIVDTYTENGWTVYKYNSGRAECYGTFEEQFEFVAQPWGGIYYKNLQGVNFPSNLFITTPILQGNAVFDMDSFSSIGNQLSATNTGGLIIMRPTPASPGVHTAIKTFYAIGRYK